MFPFEQICHPEIRERILQRYANRVEYSRRRSRAFTGTLCRDIVHGFPPSVYRSREIWRQNPARTPSRCEIPPFVGNDPNRKHAIKEKKRPLKFFLRFYFCLMGDLTLQSDPKFDRRDPIWYPSSALLKRVSFPGLSSASCWGTRSDLEDQTSGPILVLSYP